MCPRLVHLPTLLALVSAALPAAVSGQVDRGTRVRPHTPLLGAFGVTEAQQLDAYKELGLNTVWVDAPYSPEGRDAQVVELIGAAEARGLKVIVRIPTGLGWLGGTGEHRPSPYNQPYAEAVAQLVEYMTRLYGQSSAVIGWAAEHEADLRLQETDQDLRSYLKGRYATVAELNARWGTRFASLDLPALSHVEAEPETPFAINAAMLDVADFRRALRHDLLALWAQTIRRSDPERLVCTGRLTTPTTLVDVPRAYDVVVADVPPLPADADAALAGLKALALARRGGLMPAVATVYPPPPLVFPSRAEEEARARVVVQSIDQATLHGAMGVCFADWPALQANVRMHGPVADCLASGTVQRRLRESPANTAAIVHPAQSPSLVGPVEADGLEAVFGRGTRYGQFDMLGTADLAVADLDRYSCLLLPQVYFLDDEALARLQQYVLKGGAVVADVGVGVGESGSWLRLPPRLAAFLGVQRVVQAKNAFATGLRGGDARVVVAYKDLPSVPLDAKTIGSAPGPLRPVTFTGWHTLVVPTADARALAVVESARDERNEFQLAGLLVRRAGSGLVLYSSLPLWRYWLPACPVFQGLHNDLLRRRGGLQLLDEPTLLPRGAVVGMSAETAWVQHGDRLPRLLRLYVPGAGDRAYLGGAAEADAGAVAASGLRSGAEVVTVHAPPEVVTEARPVEIVCEPLAGTCTTVVRAYAPHLAQFELATNNMRLTTGPEGSLRLRAGGPAQVRVTVSAGTYRVEPGSTHQVTITDARGTQRERTLTLTADDRGRLRFTELFRHDAVTVRPAPQP